MYFPWPLILNLQIWFAIRASNYHPFSCYLNRFVYSITRLQDNVLRFWDVYEFWQAHNKNSSATAKSRSSKRLTGQWFPSKTISNQFFIYILRKLRVFPYSIKYLSDTLLNFMVRRSRVVIILKNFCFFSIEITLVRISMAVYNFIHKHLCHEWKHIEDILRWYRSPGTQITKISVSLSNCSLRSFPVFHFKQNFRFVLLS